VRPTGGNDTVLLARIGAGDDQALNVVYAEHVGLVFSLACRVTHDEQLARDITQDVFIYLWELPARVDLNRGSLRSYLSTVAYRRAIDEVRRRERRSRLESTLARSQCVDGPEAGVIATWRRQHLAALLDLLPTDQQTAVRLAYFDGLSYTEVANALGIPEGTAKSRLRLALVRLRAAAGDELRTAI
jgi:RNA polymerase sigma-70 factor, ECF subfamily